MTWNNEDGKPISITKWQALFNHEGSVWETDYASVRTVRIDGNPYDDPIIRRKIAAYISGIKRREVQYATQKAERMRGQRRRSGMGESSAELSDDYGDFLEGLGLDESSVDSSVQLPDAQTTGDLVGSQDVDLIEVTDHSRIYVEIYPLTFRCRRCGHYQIMSGDGTHLVCPECQRKTDVSTKGRAPYLTQESLVFICPHCANIEELTPVGKMPKDARGGVFDCPKGCGGHLHFYRWGSLSTSYWRCNRCRYTEKPVRRNCSCSIYASADPSSEANTQPYGPDQEATPSSQVWSMRLNPTSASNTYALQKTFVEVNKKDITLELLRAKRAQDEVAGKRSWKVDDLLQGLDDFSRSIFRQTYDLSDAFTVSDVESSTVVYGYTTHVTSNRPIQEGERLYKAFSTHAGRYRAYLIRSIGRGLVLVFDKAKIAGIAQLQVPATERRTYDELMDEELAYLTDGVFQENLDNPERFPLTSALHTIEHALFKKATDEAGLEVFASKVLARDAAVLLFERQDVGDGGIIQLVAGQQFLRLANAIYSELSGCGQDCERGCLSCTFITDFYCSPFLEAECPRWYPGNSFLDRRLARSVVGPDET